MKIKSIISIILFLLLSLQMKSQDYITIKGKVANNEDGNFIGALVQQYENSENMVSTDINGEFKIVLLKKKTNILKVTYSCNASYVVLYEVDELKEYSNIEFHTKKANRKTKKIKRDLKRRNKKTSN